VVTTKMELLELLSKAEDADVDFLREGVRVLAQALMEAEVSAQIGAERGQRTPQRATHRNGYRPRDWDTRVGTVELAIPKLRQGSYFPSLLEPRRRAERALAAVVAQCYVEGVSTRRVDDIARQLGVDGISKSQVSRVCAELDELVAAWRDRPLDAGPYPFVWLDALAMRSARAGGCATPRCWWPPQWAPTGTASCSAWSWAAPRTGRAGPGSCAGWSPVACMGSGWWSATPTRA